MQIDVVERREAVVIGGGLVGSLCVCFLAQRGYRVTMYEKRNDSRRIQEVRGRSINLALSHRGRKALRSVGLEAEVLQHAIPMKGRFLHGMVGSATSIPYDPIKGQCIYSIGRNFLNNTLLNAAERLPEVKLCFNHKLMEADFACGLIKIRNTNTKEELTVSADLIVGADGAFSKLRSWMQKAPLFNYSQHFIDHGYLELSVPSARGHKLQKNHLHIWPRKEFMMIALPNADASWTVTLFMPFGQFRSLDTSEKLLLFFQSTFPDALPLIGPEELREIYFSNRPSSLVSIKCDRYDMGDRFLIIGDAAHAMVPFYGQGMNAGFEDCSLLDQLLNETNDDVLLTIRSFTRRRQRDAHAICDLALYNYVEMRDLVTKPTFRTRKWIDGVLGKIWPDFWVPLYNSVSFGHMSYSRCVANREWQTRVIQSVVAIWVVLLIGVVWLLWKN